MTDEVSRVTPDELRRALQLNQAPVLVDVRNRTAFASGHIARSLSIPAQRLDQSVIQHTLGSGPVKRGVVLISLTGRRAEQSVAEFERFGSGNVHALAGGIVAWQRLGLPLHTPLNRRALQHQLQVIFALVLMAALAKALLLHPVFYVATAVFGSLLVFDRLAHRLGLEHLLARMPWNRRSASLVASG